MAYISFQPSDFFNTVLYTGNGTAIGSGGLAVTGVGFQPDFTWIKNRDASDSHMLFDAPRGATDILSSDSAAAESNNTESLTTWGADGFTLGNKDTVNTSAEDYVSWNWKGGTTSGITTNGSTTITPTAYSFNQTAGISILAFEGNYTNGAKLAHGLGVAPEMVFFKTLDTASDWGGYNKTITATDYIKLNDTAGATAYALAFDDTEPDAVNITLGSWEAVNGNVGVTGMVAYAFASKKGFSKIGSYTGNGNADGPFVYTGFRPAYTMIKQTSGSGTYGWYILDSKRAGYNPDNEDLLANTTGVEDTTNNFWDLCSNGFKIRTAGGNVNTSGSIYTYAAFAEFPISIIE